MFLFDLPCGGVEPGECFFQASAVCSRNGRATATREACQKLPR